MTASRATIQAVADVIEEHAISPVSMAEELAKIRGNASFETTAALLLEEIRK